MPTSRWRCCLALAVLVACPAAMAEAAGAGQATLRIGGTGAALGAMRRLGALFARQEPGVRLEILPSIGSGGAVDAVVDGDLEVGVVSRPLWPAEAARGVLAIPFVRTPFVFAAGRDTRASQIGARELAAMYRGERDTWPDGERIRLVLRPRSDSDTARIRGISPELQAAVDRALDRPGMLMASTNQECHEILARTPGSIGPSSLLQLRTDARPLRALAWEGVEPTLENLDSGTYPLFLTLAVVVHSPPSPLVSRFLEFLGSPAARHCLAQAGGLPLAPAPGAP